MLRKMIAASLILVLSVGFVFAEEIFARISKVEGNKVTFTQFKGKGQKGEEHTLPVVSKVKVQKGTYNFKEKSFEGKEVDGGLKHKMFKELPEKGLFAQIVTEDKKITEIRVLQFKGKGKGKQ